MTLDYFFRHESVVGFFEYNLEASGGRRSADTSLEATASPALRPTGSPTLILASPAPRAMAN
jgi:hypothetical protein